MKCGQSINQIFFLMKCRYITTSIRLTSCFYFLSYSPPASVSAHSPFNNTTCSKSTANTP